MKDENAKQNTKINQNEQQAHLNATRNLTMQNEINALKNKPLYSHYFSFFYQNPVANVYKGPHTSPSGFPFDFLWLTKDYNEYTTLTLLGLNTDDDSTLPTTNVNFSVEGIFHTKSGGYNSKVFLLKIFIPSELWVKMNIILVMMTPSHLPSKIFIIIGEIGINFI